VQRISRTVDARLSGTSRAPTQGWPAVAAQLAFRVHLDPRSRGALGT